MADAANKRAAEFLNSKAGDLSDNPYEAPQSLLDSDSESEPNQRWPKQEKRPSDPSILVLKILFVIALVFVETCLTILLSERLAFALGILSHSEIAIFDQVLPIVLAVYFGIGAVLWWMRK